MSEPTESPTRGADRQEAGEGRGVSYASSPARPRLVDRRKPERRALFLAEISRTLFESLDYEQTLSTVARLAMPELGAWCVVDILDGEGEVRRLAVYHPEPELQPLAAELARNFPPIETDAEAFKSDVESNTSSKVVVLAPGDTHSL